MITQPLDPADSNGTSDIMANLMRDADALAQQQREHTQEMQRLYDRLDALLDRDLGLQRPSDTESVHDLIAAAMTDLLGDIATAQAIAQGVDDISGTIGGAWRLLEVHRANDHITVRKTAKAVRQSRPIKPEETAKVMKDASFLLDQTVLPNGSVVATP